MARITGRRGSGHSKVIYTRHQSDMIDKEGNAALSRLVRLRQKLAQGQGNVDKHFEWDSEQIHVQEELYDMGIDTNNWACPCAAYDH